MWNIFGGGKASSPQHSLKHFPKEIVMTNKSLSRTTEHQCCHQWNFDLFGGGVKSWVGKSFPPPPR